MATPRKRLINLNVTSYYHCTARCVRRAFLTGVDKFSGKDYSHRKVWIRELLANLGDIFSINICAFAIMDNHYHLVLHVDRQTPIKWTFEEIFRRWTKLHKGEPIVREYLSGAKFDEEQKLALAAVAAEYRRRLMSISWFMREMNETIARKANREDEVSGRFWESRFTSQALLDESAVLSCMAYVDLNPIRAAKCKTPESSDFTSIQQRIRNLLDLKVQHQVKLLPFTQTQCSESKDPLALLTVEQYISLVDWTGRFFRNGKTGAIPEQLSPILTRLGIEEDEWLIRSQYFHQRFRCVAGFWYEIVLAAKKLKRSWFQGKPSRKIRI